MKNFFKNEKGVIAIYVIVSILTFIIILTSIHAGAVSVREGQLKTVIKIKDAYEMDLDKKQEIYEERLKPKTLSEALSTNYKFVDTLTLKDSNGKTVTIPGGYEIVTKQMDDTVDYGTDNMPQVDEGVVIQDDLKNQFVWVPVDKENTPIWTTAGTDENSRKVGQLYNFESSTSPNKPATKVNYTKTGRREPDVLSDSTEGDASTSTNPKKGMALLKEIGIGTNTSTWVQMEQIWKKQLQDEFDRMVASVEAYGGFYIGRFETGGLSDSGVTTPVVKANQTDISNTNWYYIYGSSKKIAKGSKVESSMIWGCQWDAVMNWFLSDTKTAGYVTDSTGNGNHDGSKKSTGSNPAYRVKNIYDMAGNVYETTLEATYTYQRSDRGGGFNRSGSERPASYKGGYYPYDSTGARGSRVTLLCKP